MIGALAGTMAPVCYTGGMAGMGTARLRVTAWLRMQRPDLAARDVVSVFPMLEGG